ncbi:MAG: FtsK/SpoIIIE domain-containing protein [Egibacteraceae bacterium]
MRSVWLVLDDGGQEREVELSLGTAEATVGDLLAAALGEEGALRPGVAVGGRRVGPEAPLAGLGLHDGCVVSLLAAGDVAGGALPDAAGRHGGATDGARPPHGGAGDAASQPYAGAASQPHVAVAGGLAAGAWQPLGAGCLVGRDPEADLVIDDATVSRRHLRLEAAGAGVEAEDLDSRNGTWRGHEPLDGGRCRLGLPAVLRLGATTLRVLPARPQDRPRRWGAPSARGRVFNRPPRAAPPPAPEPVAAPQPPAPAEASRALNLAAILAPLLLGAALIAVYREPRFALFMALAPVMALATWWSSRRRARRQRAQGERALRAALARFDAALGQAAAIERARLEALLPDLAEVVRRAAEPSVRLWERRSGHADALRLRAGAGPVPWQPPVSGLDRLDEGPLARVEACLARHRALADAPVEVDLRDGGVVGVVAERGTGRAVARALLAQAVVHHGPADLGLAVLTDDAAAWDWAGWLPHLRAEGAGGGLVAGAAAAEARLRAWVETAERAAASPAARAGPSRTRLVVVDDPALLTGRGSALRGVLAGAAGPVAGIVLAPTADALPAVTSTVLEVTGDGGLARLCRPRTGSGVDDVVVDGLVEPLARGLARALAGFEDPEHVPAGGGLPARVRLGGLLDLDGDGPLAGRLAARWRAAGEDPAPAVPLGLAREGPVVVDLVADGPHALVGGTTGAGKSELLRTLLAGLAAGSSPDHLVAVLIDYKGGSAFDACARLPHVVGLVTDLDGHLAERALRSLEAELRQRETLLRAAGCEDLRAYRAAGSPEGPLPRLLVVVDEFATLAAELPDFLGALVGIAQRGRSLGVHLVLATQRPSGSISATIKANTNLRIALRVQDAQDAVDVVGTPEAADLPRDLPGRACARLGPGEVVTLQTATVSLPAAGESGTPVRLRPRPSAGAASGDPGDPAEPGGGPREIDDLVEAAAAAARAEGLLPRRRPWLEMLPERIGPEDLAAADDDREVVFALGDDPDRQRRVGVGWRLDDGHLAILGMVGSGTSTALRSIAAALARSHEPSALHLYGLDAGGGALRGLEALPHCGALASAAEPERQRRVVRRLRAEVARRRARQGGGAGLPLVVGLVDGLGALLDALEAPELADAGEDLRRVLADGPAVGVVLALAADRPGALPSRLAPLVGERLLLRLPDPGEYAAAGLRPREVPELPPGRLVRASDGLVAHVADPGDLAALAATLPAVAGGPAPVDVLPERLPAEAVPAEGDLSAGLDLAVGLRDDDLAPARLVLGPGAHALVAGPPRSGVSSALRALAERLRAGAADLVLVGVSEERSPLRGCRALDAAGRAEDLAGVLAAAAGDSRRWVVLVDDATTVEHPALAALARHARPGLHLVAGGRCEDLRRAYHHWTRELRAGRCGLLLRPDLTADGDLLGVRLPRRTALPLSPGRGFLVVDGQADLVQVALPQAG